MFVGKLLNLQNETKQNKEAIFSSIGNGETGLCICCYWKYKLVQSFLSKIFDRIYQNLRSHDVKAPFLGIYPPAIFTREYAGYCSTTRKGKN